jgi:glucose-fructose oxidoreductase
MKRRNFIRNASLGAAGATLLGSSFANILVQKKKDRLGIALVGLGYYSTDLLAPALQLTSKCYLAGIVTGTPSKAETWKKEHKLQDKDIYNYQSFDSIANNPDIDVVYVVLPPSMHAEYTIRAAKAGKHVWCEKPMAVTEAECKSMIDACNQNKVKLAIGYRMQHEPNTQKIIQFRKDRTYGNVMKVTAAAGYFDSRTDHWKQKKSLGGGCTLDMGVYPLNAARYSTGLEPIAVTAQASTTRPEIYKEVEETMKFDLEFPGGVTAVCETSLGKGMNDLNVTCSKGWYKLSPFQAYSGVNGAASDGTKLNAVIPNEQSKQMDDDAVAIMNSKPLIAPGEEGLRDIRVTDAIFKSASENKRISIGSN